MRKWIVRAGLVVLIVLVVSQFIPVDRTNPPVESDGSVSDLHFIELDPQATFVPRLLLDSRVVACKDGVY
jgi:hypothetical protein